MQDPLDVSEVLGKLARRADDPSARRRAIAARIGVLSLYGRAIPPEAEIMAEAPEPLAELAPIAAPKESEPTAKKPPKAKGLKMIVGIEDTAVLLDAIALSDKVKKATDLPGREVSAPQSSMEERQTVAEEFTLTDLSAQMAAPSAPVAMPLGDLAASAPALNSEDISHATKQTTSKVLNLAALSDLPTEVVAHPSEDGPMMTTSADQDAETKAPRKKGRGKKTISFDVSALSELWQDDAEEPKAPVKDGFSDQSDLPGDGTPKQT